jgi:uroporphyrin-III C-methyltransferase
MTPDAAVPPALPDPGATAAPGDLVPAAAVLPAAEAPVRRRSLLRPMVWLAVALMALALLSTGLLLRKLSRIQEQLARQAAEATALATEARTLSKQAQEVVRETAARVAMAEARVSEVALQRTQLEDLIQSLSRSRDENLVVDIESALRLAQQQAQLTGSVEPLLAALRTADQRIVRAAQPRLTPLQRALARDIDRIKAAAVTDTPGLLVKLDELIRQADDLPVANAVALPLSASRGAEAEVPASNWWGRAMQRVQTEARALLRVSRIEQPEAALLSPEQSFFLRENLKFKLLNARLGLLARQMESARADLAAGSAMLNKYFDPASRKTQSAAGLLQQVQAQMKTAELPRIDETLAALSTAAAGR